MSKKQQFKGLKFNYSINGKGLKSKYKTIEDFLNTEFPKNNNPLSPTLDTEITGIKWNGNTISITNKIHTVRDLVDLLSKENAENVFISNKDIRLHEFKPKHDVPFLIPPVFLRFQVNIYWFRCASKASRGSFSFPVPGTTKRPFTIISSVVLSLRITVIFPSSSYGIVISV